MLRRSQSRTLIASAVLLACLTLTGQTRAQMSRTGTMVPIASASKAGFSQGIIARAQRILIAHSARTQHTLLRLPAATLPTALIAPTAATNLTALPPGTPGLWANKPWQRTSRAFAS